MDNKKDKGVIRFNNIGFKREYFGEGGMNINKKKRVLEGKKNCELINGCREHYQKIDLYLKQNNLK